MGDFLQVAKLWAKNGYFNEAFREEIRNLLEAKDHKELEDRFHKDLEFGTGGMRGIIGAGSNRINQYTIQKATQGLADYIYQQKGENGSVAIAYDSRRFSKYFAEEVACVLAANKIKVYLYPNIHPTPLLSYAVLKLKTTAGIVITASHNPPEYNGYKVYWEEGCQVTPPHDQNIIQAVKAINDFSKIKKLDFKSALEDQLVEFISEEMDDAYLTAIEEEALGEIKMNAELPFIYTPLHGVGRNLTKQLMMKRGFSNLRIVPSQEFPDENFSTVHSPNPEDPNAYEEAKKFAEERDRLIIATDPDADRIGVLVKEEQDWFRLTGNQIGALLLEYKLRKLQEKNKLPNNGFIVSTVVTSELIKKIALKNKLHVYETLTGFKYIGNQTHQAIERGQIYLFSCEESHGYQFESFIREKDGISAAMFFAEMLAELFYNGKTISEQLNLIYEKYGYHSDELVNIRLTGVSGAKKIQNIMKQLRTNPFKQIGGLKVVEIRDYLSQVKSNTKENITTTMNHLPKENLLGFYLENGSRISIRPSGTEPLIKYYFNLCSENKKTTEEQKTIISQEFNQIIENYRK